MKRGNGLRPSGLGDRQGLPTRFGGFGTQHQTSTLSYLAEPPALSTVSDPQVVVQLKNVLKKDSTTKGRALEELVNYVQTSTTDVEDALLDIWVQIYPRVSIDNSRRVRELSHSLQLELLKSGRKRMERRLHGIVAVWVAGSFDRDRAVARVASAGLSSFLDTPGKMNAFWIKCQSQILDFAIEAMRETRDSLSDERSTTPEDAEAKYFRVVYASLSLVIGLLQRVPGDTMSTCQTQYDDYFGDNTAWQHIETLESSIRKAVCHLMFACVDRGLPYGATKQAKTEFLIGGLSTTQAGTALEYVRALTKVTEAYPEIWSDVKRKKSPFDLLCAFIAKGSQGSPPKYWEQLDALVQSLPELPNEDDRLEQASKLLSSVQKGMTHREEPRTNTSFAWKCYMDTAKRLLGRLPPADQLSFASDTLIPLFERFLLSAPGAKTFIPMGPNAMGILVQAHNTLAGSESLRPALVDEWDKLATMFCANISGLLPEVSKDFQASQDRIAEEGRRWYSLVGELQRASPSVATTADISMEPSTRVLEQCFQILRNRNLKPVGAARVVSFALSNSKHLFHGDLGRQCLAFLSAAPENGIQTVLESPSGQSLLPLPRFMCLVPAHRAAASDVWRQWVKLLLEAPISAARDNGIATMISSEDVSQFAQDTPALQHELSKQFRRGGQASAPSWNVVDAAIQFHAFSSSTVQSVVKELVTQLGSNDKETSLALTALDRLARSHSASLVDDEAVHKSLIEQLLVLKSSQDIEIATKASSISSILGGASQNTLPSIVGIIHQNLESAGPQSISVETLVQQAQDALNGGVSAEEIFPSTNLSMEALRPLLERPIDPSIAIMSLTGDAALLPVPSGSPTSSRPLARDANGASIPARIALYVCHLREKSGAFSTLPQKFQVELIYFQALVAQLASDQISLDSTGWLWSSVDSSEIQAEAEWLVSTSRRQLLELAESCTDWQSAANVMPEVVGLLAKESMTLTPVACHSSRVLGELFELVVEQQGIPAAWEEKYLGTEILKASPETVLLAAAALAGMGPALRSLKSVNTLCNRLVSDIAAAKASTEKAKIQLALLPLCGSIYENGALPIPSNRVVFAVKQITDWLDDDSELSPAFTGECLRCLSWLLPCVKDVYGSFWEKSLQFCVRSWETAGNHPLEDVLPLLHASLKLTRDLQEMEEVNDDLEECLADFSKQKGAGLVNLLRLDREKSTQPLKIVDGLLRREVEKLAKSQLPEAEDLYGLVASDSEAIQSASFAMLHRIVPEQQQQKSVDALLDNIDARLPDELLSLLLDAPTLEQYSEEMLATFPLSIRGYLLSWKLIFDAFGASSFKVRASYTEGLKADNAVGPLLDFMFDVLGHSAGYPLKLDKEGITSEQIRDFDIKLAEAEQEEKSMHWLLVHLYYLALKYLPGLFRLWFQDCRSKQTKMAVESWTESFFSPLIIEDALSDVQDWANGKDFEAPGEAEITVKVSKSGREVSAWYEIDEAQGGMAINLPTNFPIERVSVRGIRRVAVDERKWQSWIMATQGVITFSNFNIIDGVQAFRRNLTGALQGHTECAICYSVISSDRRVPEKRCTTCKNIFHRLCLYKWFQTSNNNTCPLCRTPIDFAGASMQKRTETV